MKPLAWLKNIKHRDISPSFSKSSCKRQTAASSAARDERRATGQRELVTRSETSERSRKGHLLETL